MNIPPHPFHSDSLVFEDLTYFIGNNHFCCTILLVTTTPSAVVAICSKPVYNHCHRVYFRFRTISLPWHYSFGFACSHLEHFFVVTEASFTAKQRTLPLILYKCSNNFLIQIGWMTFWYSRLLHTSSKSSFLGTSSKVYMYSPFAACVKKYLQL
jgi:hypothetical protein